LKKFLLLPLFITILLNGYPQTHSCRLRISLLTCSPGEEVYALFGHSAIRLTDSLQGFDVIFNYGSFDFEDPNFYSKFGRGNMRYFVSVENMNDFIDQYRYEKRSIIEQELNLSCDEKEQLSAFLKDNAKEENKYYLYNFLFDNCSSRLKDIVAKKTAAPLAFQNILPADNTSFRKLIHEYSGRQPWTKLGLDILLGAALDVKIRNEQALFLPEYLMKAFDGAAAGNKNLVATKKIVLNAPVTERVTGLPSPLLFFSLFSILIATISFLKKKWAITLLNGIDFLLFFTAGVTGLLMLTLWVVRSDTVCRNNFNLLWALPSHALLAFFLLSRKRWVLNYWLITALLQLLLLIGWFIIPQQLNNALIPVVALLLLRSWLRYKKK
jgi:Domain of unknown function (DUF4105)